MFYIYHIISIMEKENFETSLVIIAQYHNPTVVTDNFFINSKIIKDIKEINRENLFVTPALSQYNFKNNIVFLVEPSRLIIKCKEGELPFEYGEKYCKNLPFIVAIAVGINFKYNLFKYDFDKWFSNFKHVNIEGIVTKKIVYSLKYKDTVCTVNILKKSKDEVMFHVNYQKDYDMIPLSEIDSKFKEKAKLLKMHSNDLISKMFNN